MRLLKRESGSLRGTFWMASQVWALGASLMHASSQSLVLIISDLDTRALSYDFIVYWVAWICLIYSFYIDLFAQPFINHVIPLSFFINPSLHLLLSLNPRISSYTHLHVCPSFAAITLAHWNTAGARTCPDNASLKLASRWSELVSKLLGRVVLEMEVWDVVAVCEVMSLDFSAPEVDLEEPAPGVAATMSWHSRLLTVGAHVPLTWIVQPKPRLLPQVLHQRWLQPLLVWFRSLDTSPHPWL